MFLFLPYRVDVPQEGSFTVSGGAVDARVATFPTIRGERAVVRLLPATSDLIDLTELGLSSGMVSVLRASAERPGGNRERSLTQPSATLLTVAIRSRLRRSAGRTGDEGRRRRLVRRLFGQLVVRGRFVELELLEIDGVEWVVPLIRRVGQAGPSSHCVGIVPCRAGFGAHVASLDRNT